MRLKRLEILGFKSFARKAVFDFDAQISSVVGPNGSGKSNVAESIRFVLGEQSMKSLRGKRGEDLIWNGSGAIGRSNHASVAIVFDNSEKEFEIDYEEVEIKRQVFRDGSNQYFINGTQVRLRDIIELLAKVHIGATGHHIISQGEADRILSANIKERRAMIEEALGLKIYQWKIDESQKKLSKTEENIKQVESLRREIAPHIRFLKKQVEKIEKASQMRESLKVMYSEYLKREDLYIKNESRQLEDKIKEPEIELANVESKLQKAREELASSDSADPKGEELVVLERKISSARNEKDELSRALGRVEGMVLFEKKRLEKASSTGVAVENIAYSKVHDFTEDIKKQIDTADNTENVDELRNVFVKLKNTVSVFVSSIASSGEEAKPDETELSSLLVEKSEIETSLRLAVAKTDELSAEYNNLRRDIEKEKDSSRNIERDMFEMMAKKSELSAKISRIKDSVEMLNVAERELKEEVSEGVILVGRDILLYENFAIDEMEVYDEVRSVQIERRKQIEKIKIKLEDSGVGNGGEVLSEYKESTERDEFLEREIEDLHKSADSLRELINELAQQLDEDFKAGLMKINKQFQEFFSLMFGGGSAGLFVVTQKKRKRKDTELLADDESVAVAMNEEEELDEGIDINISLPRKKIKGLQMLSGGERALTSIALIFAVSQVNPPPFLVLDETDAALDEANSRKYGDMLENLSRSSQLIVITHNRETMSRAGLLYGVTMGADAVSKLLSVKLDEAEQFAK